MRTSSISLETLKKKFEEEHALIALICLWVFSYDVDQKLVYNVSFLQANDGDVLTEVLCFSIQKKITAAFAVGGWKGRH